MMKDMKKTKDMNYMRVKVFFKKKILVHISKKNGTFYNGYILEEPTHDFFFIDDKETGRQLILFVELNKPIEEFKERR